MSTIGPVLSCKDASCMEMPSGRTGWWSYVNTQQFSSSIGIQKWPWIG
jgi:hypothetical protein